MISRQKVKPIANTPLYLTLERAQGVECNSQYSTDGKEYRYDVLTQEGKAGFIYLPAIARDLLIRSGATDGEAIRVLKTGANGSTRWQIDPISDAAQPAQITQVRNTAPITRQPETATIPTTHPIQDRSKRLLIAAAGTLRDAYLQITVDPFYADLEKPNFDDIRTLATHWAISAEKRGA